jgi:hypothetical protein
MLRAARWLSRVPRIPVDGDPRAVNEWLCEYRLWCRTWAAVLAFGGGFGLAFAILKRNV